MNISAIIVVTGSSPYLLQTLQSIEDIVSEVIIGDNGIEDEMRRQLEKQEKNTIVKFGEKIPYVELVREELTAKTKNDFVLYMDPDEIFPSSITKADLEKLQQYDYVHFPRKNMIFRKWIQHARWWPDYQLRYFKKSSITWQKELHSAPKVEGEGYKFEAKEEFAILHHNYETIDEFMSKLPRYAKAEAREKQEKNEPFTLSIAVKNAISEFMARFFSSEGFKDGMHGFALSVLQMFYCFLVYFYYWELKKYPEMTTKELTESTDEFFKQGLYETKFWKDRHNLSDALNKLKMKIVKRL